MTPLETYTKDPNAKLDYGIRWASWLAVGETILTSTWVCPGLTVSDESTGESETLATLWLAGGKHNHDYYATNHITTTAGRIDDRTICIQVRQR